MGCDKKPLKTRGNINENNNWQFNLKNKRKTMILLMGKPNKYDADFGDKVRNTL